MLEVVRDRPTDRSSFSGLWLATLGKSTDTGAARSQRLIEGGGRCFHFRMLEESPAPDTCSLDGVGIIFDGFLYNRSELVSQLGRWASEDHGDAELVLRGFQRWGEGVLDRLKGIFAFCLWDGYRGRLLAARDRVGIFPLFYMEESDRLHFGTSTDAFASSTGPGLTVDRVVLAGMIARQYPEADETFFRGIKRVSPGHALIQDLSGLRVKRYWNRPPVGAGAEWVQEDELGQFGDLLDQAVGRALSAGQAGIFLSGGLDSVSVAAVAAEHTRSKGVPSPHALSLLFPGDVREEGVQRGVADQLGIEQSVLEFDEGVGPAGLMASALALSATGSAPLQNVWLPAYQKLAQIGKQRGCRTILTGGGGDEWLTVTPQVSADLIRSFDFVGLFRYIATLERSMSLPRLPLWRNVTWTNGVKPLLSAQYQKLANGIAPGLRGRRLERRLAKRLQARPEWMIPEPGLRRALDRRAEERFHEAVARAAGPGAGGYYFTDMNEALLNPLFAIDMEEVFENGRRQGMMQHDIYWDADLIEFAYRVPPHLLNRGGRSKGLVRQDLSRRFPDLGFDRQKKLFAREFFCNLLLDEGGSAWQAMGGTPALAELGIVEPRHLERYVRDVLESRDERRVDDVWRILSLESWVRPRV